MEIYSENKEYKLYHGNMLDLLQVIEPNSIDSIVTDPPYELNFMGKGWDNSGIAFQKETWQKCLEVLKPGGYLLAFGGSRTYHRIACAIEDAGFEIRDCIMWLYGSGFPKSMNIGLAIDKKNGVDNRTGNIKTDGKGTDSGSGCYNMNNGNSNMGKEYEERVATNERKGWGTALKPSYEPIIVARKPLEGSCTDNVIKYGVGGINIDECRVGNEVISIHNAPAGTFAGGEYDRGSDTESYRDSVGRFPANTILTYSDEDKEEVCSGFPYNKATIGPAAYQGKYTKNGWKMTSNANISNAGYTDSSSAARYFKNCNFSLRDIDQWKQLYVSNAEKSLESLSETIESIVPINADMLLGMLKDLNVKYAENQLDLGEIHIVPDIVEMLTYDFRKEGSQVILDFIGNYKNCIQLQSLVQFVEKCDSIDTTQTTQNLLKLFGYVRAAITKYTQTIKNEEQKRYIYTPKASKRDRDEGLDEFEQNKVNDGRQTPIDNAFQRGETLRKNVHPCVKPTDLMQYLVRLVTPNGGTVLDPFNGSGSTGKAVMYENKDRNKGYKYIGIELTEEYLPIAKARIEYVIEKGGELKEQTLF